MGEAWAGPRERHFSSPSPWIGGDRIEETGCGIAESVRRRWFNDTALAVSRGQVVVVVVVVKTFFASVYVNDPAAGSPTATLLRLLLPLASGHRQSSAGHHAPEGTRAVDLQVALASHHR